MKPIAFVALVVVMASPEIGYFRYQRPVQNVPQQAGQTCMALDGEIFSHAAPQLADLRLFHDGAETPYAIHLAAPMQGDERSIAPLNLGRRTGQTVFDAAMPDGTYSDVELAVAARDFIASVVVTGSQAETGSVETKIGSYTIFDLSHQKLGRSTVLHLPDSDFRYLHFWVMGSIPPESISGLSVGRLPSGQPKYVTVAESARSTQVGRTTVFEFSVPTHVPVDRIVFTPGAEPVNFSRDASVTVAPASPPPATDQTEPQQLAASSGNLLRVHTVQNGTRIAEERLTIDAPGMEFGTASKWKVTIDNGDDRPLALESVRLEMLERSLCFDAAAGGQYMLYYGDPVLDSPRYDYARLFAAQAKAPQATPGQEQLNAAFHPRPDQRPFTEKHPALLWIALVAVVALLGAIAMRSAKRTQPTA